MPRFKSVTVKPSQGGRLLSRVSEAEAGIENYTIKRDWRRDLDREVKREGYDWFWGNQERDLGDQPYPGGSGLNEEINLVHSARRPNGKTAVIVGTKSKLFRFASSVAGYATDYATDYTEENTGDWVQIGSGFSSSGNRWEALNINGYTVFNNGVDLPQVYRLEWDSVKPLYEMREQGISHVGTIAAYNGILVCGDVSEIGSTALTTLMSPKSATVTASQIGSKFSQPTVASMTASTTDITATTAFFDAADVGKYVRFTNGFKTKIIGGSGSSVQVDTAPSSNVTDLGFFLVDEADATGSYTVTASDSYFSSNMVGLNILWDSGETRKIKKFISATAVVVDQDALVQSGSFQLENSSSYSAYSLSTTRRQYRLIWSLPDYPEEWGVVLKGSMTSESNVLTLAWPAKSLIVGDSLTITGAGTNGGNLIAKITLIEQGGRVIRLAENAVTTVTSATVQPTTSIGSIIGYDDIQDDGSGILKMAELQGNLVVYRDTAIYLMEYTGSTASPFNVTKLETPGGKSLYYRHTLVNINGREHVYAGRSSFYEFDLSSRIPREIPAADAVSNSFYDTAKVEDTEKIFSVHNTPTQEVWVFGTGTTDKVLCYDYRYGTFSTTNVPVTAAASVKKPEVSLVTEESEDWFIMGDATGVVYTYGKVDKSLKWGDAATTGKAIYYRRGVTDKSAYESLMKFGLTNFGNNLDEKDLRGYVLHLSSKTAGNPEVTVNIYGTRNEAEAPTLLGSKTLDNAETKSLIPCYFRQHLFQDEIKASGLIDVQFSGRTFDAARIDTESLIRTN
jgi:hypothetical protein